MHRTRLIFFGIVILTVIAGFLALPPVQAWRFNLGGKEFNFNFGLPPRQMSVFGRTFSLPLSLKQGLDIQGGMQVVLSANMTDIEPDRRVEALEAAQEVLRRRVDLFGINEPQVQTAIQEDDYRLLVELPGVVDTNQALQLVGTTAQLKFKLQTEQPATSSGTLLELFGNFEETGLTGKELRRAQVQFDQQTGQPVISLEFNAVGKELFAKITQENTGKVLGIFLDDYPVALPSIKTPILDGRAQMTGAFTLDEAKQLAIQLNAGALPIPISVIGQRQIGASLGQEAVQKSIKAGLIGLSLVMVFMILYYGVKGLLASLALVVYSLITIALYKLLGVTLTLPGIAGLLLSIGMAVDANILIFERMKEELRLGRPFERALELGFGRAWDSIKDANLATIFTALILINPLDFSFLNTSGLVRGFGITLLIGVLISLFTGVVVTRTFMRLFLRTS